MLLYPMVPITITRSDSGNRNSDEQDIWQHLKLGTSLYENFNPFKVALTQIVCISDISEIVLTCRIVLPTQYQRQ